jgi:hypothetical protein
MSAGLTKSPKYLHRNLRQAEISPKDCREAWLGMVTARDQYETCPLNEARQDHGIIVCLPGSHPSHMTVTRANILSRAASSYVVLDQDPSGQAREATS